MIPAQPDSTLSGRATQPPEPEHGRERWRRIWHAAFGAAAFRGVSIAGTLVTVPLVLAELGSVRFGALVLITQLATLLVFSDLGLGNGLVTALARSLAENDHRRARSLVSSTWFLLVGVMLIGGALFTVATLFVDWARLLGVEEVSQSQVTASVVVFAVFFLVGLPASISQKIHLAHQEGMQANVWQTVGALLTIGATVACVVVSADLPWFVAAAVGGAVVSAVINCAWLFISRPGLRPHRRYVNVDVVRFIFGTGVLFLVLGVAGAVAYQTDALVISHLLGPEEVTTYNLAVRLFLVPGLVVSFLVAPLWPAFSDAFARKEHDWARQTLRRAVTWGAWVTIPGALFLIVFGQQLMDLWVGKGEVTIPTLLLVALGLWTALTAVSGPMAMLFNGAHVVKFQVVCAVAMAISNIALSLALTPWLGVAGPVFGTVIAQSVCITIPSLLYMSRLWSRV